MKKVLEKYLKIAKANAGENNIKIDLDEGLRSSASSNKLGRYLYRKYGIVEIGFAEPGYMQFKFIFNCINENFSLVRYPSNYGTIKGVVLKPNESSKKRKLAYKKLMEKAIGHVAERDGWVFKNITMAVNPSKRKAVEKEETPVNLKVKNKPEQEISNVKKNEETNKTKNVEETPAPSIEKIDPPISGKNIIIGDSQIAGNMGKELASIYGGYREGVTGSTPSDWIDKVKDGDLNLKLKESPENIIMLFGGYGTQGTTELLNEIYSITPMSNIHFLSLPAPAMTNKNITLHEKVFGKKFDYLSLYKKREALRDDLEQKVLSSKPYSEGNVNFIDVFAFSWECTRGCDGIHLTSDAAKNIVSQITTDMSVS